METLLNFSITIPITFVILTVLLLWIIIGSRGHWLAKLTCIAATLMFSVLVWNSIPTYMGWPTKEDPPKKVLLQWILVQEPNQKTGYSGNILIWAKNLKPSNEQSFWDILNYDGGSQPRVYAIPYSREAHKQVEQVQKMIAGKKSVVAEFEGKKMNGKVGDGQGDGGKGSGRNSPNGTLQGVPGDGQGTGMSSAGVKFYQLPPPKYPSKTPDN